MEPGTRAELERLRAVAGNGLLGRRAFLRGGGRVRRWPRRAIRSPRSAGAAPARGRPVEPRARRDPLRPTNNARGSRQRSRRTLSNPKGETRTSHARTPHHLLNGTFTPNGLHFTIVHSGTPDIDPDKHRLVIHGLVNRPPRLLARCARAPTRWCRAWTFVECGGNARRCFPRSRIQASVQALHGLASCAEWDRCFRFPPLLEETGIDPRAKWLIAEGADSLALRPKRSR